MNNLRKFTTEAEYTAASLNYPAVSWVTSTDTVHFDKSAAVNNKVKIAFTTDACGQGKIFNLVIGEYFSDMIANLNGITVNGEPFTPLTSDAHLVLANNTDYLIEYELKDGVSNVGNWFALPPADGCSSIFRDYDILFPAQVTTVTALYDGGDKINNLLLEETTPPSVTLTSSAIPNVYVTDSAVNTYKSAEGWGEVSSYIHPISEYSGNIPT